MTQPISKQKLSTGPDKRSIRHAILRASSSAYAMYSPYLLWTCFIVLALIKLALIRNNEILAVYFPHDDLWHILAAERAFWFAKEYTQMTFIQYPVYSLFIFLVHFIGIPLRIIIELVFIASGISLSLSLIRVGLNKFLGILCFTLIIFQPVSFSLFDHTLAETLYAPLLLFVVASFIRLWLKRKQGNSLLASLPTGILLALLWLTRKESLLIALFLLCVLLIIMIESPRKERFSRKTFLIIKKMIIIPSAVISVFYILLCTANYFTFGLFAPSELNGNGYKSAYHALQSIQTHEVIRYVPVSSKARAIAYSISPSFQKLAPFLEDRNNFAFEWSEKSQGIKGEMAAGWFYWVFRDAVYNAGYKTAASADMFDKRIAEEINTAIEDHRIESRSVIFDFLDPNFYRFLPELPGSFFRITKLLVNSQEPIPLFDDSRLPDEYTNTINSMANRRITTVEQRENRLTRISGWTFSYGEALPSVSLINASGEILTTDDSLDDRQDVQDFYTKDNQSVPINSGFSLTYDGNRNNIQNGFLRFTTTRNENLDIPIKSLEKDVATEIGNGRVLFSLENKDIPRKNSVLKTSDKAKRIIWKYYGKILLALSLIALFSFIHKVLWGEIQLDDITIVLILLLTLILARIFLFSLLDIDSWDGAQARYIFPIMPLYSTAMFLLLQKFPRLAKNERNT